jgi:hypothetical protein
MTSESQFRFRPEERALLESVLNEVLNGFEVPEFEKKIGMERKCLDNFLKHLHTLSDGQEVMLDLAEARAFRSALFETIRELGVEEFQTRTGCGFGHGNAVLRKLDHLLGNVGDWEVGIDES